MIDGLFLGIDCGTQGLKTLVLDGGSGAVLAVAKRKYSVIPGLPPGVSEQHPKVWIAAATATIREAAAKVKAHKKKISGVAVSGQQHGMVALDESGAVLRPAKLWNDVSTAAEAKNLIDACGGVAAVRRITGNVMPPGFTASKVLWMKRAEPALFARAASILLPHDYLNFWLTGERTTEAGDASGTCYFDLRNRAYSPAILSAIDAKLYEKVPPIVPAGAAVGRVRPQLAKQLGLPADVPVGHGGGDNMMAAFGTGNTRRGVVTISLGTSGTAFAYSSAPIVDQAGEIAAFCDSTGGYLPLLCIQNCTNTTELIKRLLRLDDAELDREARKAPAGARGAALLPFFTGERTPNLPDATGALLGLTESNFSRECLARAAMEAPALQLGYGLERLRRLGAVPTEVRLTGGGSRSALWRRICADVTGLPAVCLETDEGAALGAALCAQWCASREAGHAVSADEIAQRAVKMNEGTRAHPDAANHELYQSLQPKRASATAALKPIFGALREASRS